MARRSFPRELLGYFFSFVVEHEYVRDILESRDGPAAVLCKRVHWTIHERSLMSISVSSTTFLCGAREV
jgi:hypothetical protein